MSLKPSTSLPTRSPSSAGAPPVSAAGGGWEGVGGGRRAGLRGPLLEQVEQALRRLELAERGQACDLLEGAGSVAQREKRAVLGVHPLGAPVRPGPGDDAAGRDALPEVRELVHAADALHEHRLRGQVHLGGPALGGEPLEQHEDAGADERRRVDDLLHLLLEVVVQVRLLEEAAVDEDLTESLLGPHVEHRLLDLLGADHAEAREDLAEPLGGLGRRRHAHDPRLEEDAALHVAGHDHQLALEVGRRDDLEHLDRAERAADLPRQDDLRAAPARGLAPEQEQAVGSREEPVRAGPVSQAAGDRPTDRNDLSLAVDEHELVLVVLVNRHPHGHLSAETPGNSPFSRLIAALTNLRPVLYKGRPQRPTPLGATRPRRTRT